MDADYTLLGDTTHVLHVRPLRPIYKAAGLAGLCALAMLGLRESDRVQNNTQSQARPSLAPPFTPKYGLAGVVVKPGHLPGPLQVAPVPPATGPTGPACLLVHNTSPEIKAWVEQETAAGAKVEEAWLYGVKQTTPHSLPHVTGLCGDAVAGQLLCWGPRTWATKLQQADQLLKAVSGVRRTVVKAVKRNGDNQQAHWHYQFVEPSSLPKPSREEEIMQILQHDFDNFPHMDWEIYSPNVYFSDPTTSFYGIAPYKRNIYFLAKWMTNLKLILHKVEQTGPGAIRTDWTFCFDSPVPWHPHIDIQGWSDLELDSDGLVSKHLDYWSDSSIKEIIAQHFMSKKCVLDN